MNKALPVIKESVEDLRKKIKTQSDSRKKNRLQALFLVASGQAKHRSEVARLLGFNRNSISTWFANYETGGLEKMLEIEKPKGQPTLIPGCAATEIEKTLNSAEGFRTYKEIHALVVGKYDTKITYSAVYKFVRYRMGAKPKSPRHSNPKKT
jgi:transposase